MNLIDRIKKILGIDNQDELISEIIEVIQDRIKIYIGAETIPETLDWIVVEASVARFNRIGSEGMSSESVDGNSVSYKDDELSQYKVYLDKYVTEHLNRSKGYKLL